MKAVWNWIQSVFKRKADYPHAKETRVQLARFRSQFSDDEYAHFARLLSGDSAYIKQWTLPKEKYDWYIGANGNTPHPYWAAFGRFLYLLRGHECEGITSEQPCPYCNRARHTHHRKYPGVLGLEILHLDMMRRLCQPCHEYAHFGRIYQNYSRAHTAELMRFESRQNERHTELQRELTEVKSRMNDRK